MDLKFFNLEEFDCKCCGKNQIDKCFVEALDFARENAGIPFVITSGYRCYNHNYASGGVKNSAHTKGLAADIRCRDDHERYLIIKALLDTGFQRIGVGQGFVHVDDDVLRKKPEIIWGYNE